MPHPNSASTPPPPSTPDSPLAAQATPDAQPTLPHFDLPPPHAAPASPAPPPLPSPFEAPQPSLPPPSFPLTQPQHEAFARHIAEGLNGQEAYRRVYPRAARHPGSTASKLRARPEVRARIAWLQAQAATDAVMNLREILTFLTAVKRTPAGDVTATSELAERYEVNERGVKKIWLPDKRACVELCAKLQGLFTDRSRAEPVSTPAAEPAPALPESLRLQLLERRNQARRAEAGGNDE